MHHAEHHPIEVDAALLATMPLPRHDAATSKHQRGSVGIIGGARETPGGVLLAGVAALRSGAGRVEIATVHSAAASLAVAFPEARVIGVEETADGAISPRAASRAFESMRCDAFLVGSGAVDPVATGDLLRRLTATSGSSAFMVIDAAAIAVLADEPQVLARYRGRGVVMPNPAEMATLLACGEQLVENDPAAAIDEAVERLGSVVALRGSQTWIGAPAGERFLDRAGHPALATAGSGDVCAGVLTALLARGADPLVAATWAVHVHGVTGNRLAAGRDAPGLLARDLLDELPDTFAALCEPTASGLRSQKERGPLERSHGQ